MKTGYVPLVEGAHGDRHACVGCAAQGASPACASFTEQRDIRMKVPL
ncbi:MAG: hypothetical protein II969_18370 [Anaerolineaceae bacterium]|nr:hypothetical protein [Anaerolineaceae bacterium]